MAILVTCKFEEDSIESEVAILRTTFYKSNYNINRISKLQRRACKLILSQEYNGLEGHLKD